MAGGPQLLLPLQLTPSALADRIDKAEAVRAKALTMEVERRNCMAVDYQKIYKQVTRVGLGLEIWFIKEV